MWDGVAGAGSRTGHHRAGKAGNLFEKKDPDAGKD